MKGVHVALLFCIISALYHVDIEGFIKLGEIDRGGVKLNLHLIDTYKVFADRFYSWYNVTLKFKDSTGNDILQEELDKDGSDWKLITWNFTTLSYVGLYVNNTKWFTFIVPDGYPLPHHADYLGPFLQTSIGKKVRGHVFLDRAGGEFYLPGFRFIGETVPDTFFWLDTTVLATENGWISSRSGIFTKMSTYDNIDFTVTLPVGYTNVSYFRSLTVWCRRARVSFGYVEIPPSNFSNPFTCESYGPVSTILDPVVHLSSGVAYITGPQSITYINFTFDGTAPATWFWLGPETGTDLTNLADGVIIPDERGTLYRFVQSTDATIAIKLPLGHSLCSSNFFLSVYCVKASASFGEIYDYDFNCTGCPAVYTTESTKDPLPWYCLILSNASDANVRIEYQLDETNNEVNFRIYTCNFEVNDYIAFGLSGSPSSTSMMGGDVCVCRFDGDLKAPVCNDYNLKSRSQCAASGGSYDGACPDAIFGGSDDCSKVSIYREDGITIFGFSRKITGNDINDANIVLGTEQYLIWARGRTFPASTGDPNDRWVLKHATTERASATNPIKLDFNASNDTCGIYRYLCTSTSIQDDPWTIEPVCGDNLPSNGFISAVIGPSGPQNRGYDAITGQGGWGIAWYLNGKLIPELYLRRGVTYSFTENGGVSTDPPANYHPFYLTDSPVGGIMGRANAGNDISGETVYAGLHVNSSGVVTDPNEYTLCQYSVMSGSNVDVDTYGEFKDLFLPFCCPYTKSFTFAPDDNTPDTIYYQCGTHQLLGWKIHIVDSYAGTICAANKLAQFSPIILLAMLLAVFIL